jgi:hypothetical protein
MVQRILLLTFSTSALWLGNGLLAADDSSLGKDLKATIVLQGMPCDQLVASKRNGDSDYTASCKDGNRYHIFVNAQGRVIVQKL